MTVSKSRSPSPTSRHHRCSGKTAVVVMLVLVVVPLLCVGAFAGRGFQGGDGRSFAPANANADILDSEVRNPSLLSATAIQRGSPRVFLSFVRSSLTMLKYLLLYDSSCKYVQELTWRRDLHVALCCLHFLTVVSLACTAAKQQE